MLSLNRLSCAWIGSLAMVVLIASAVNGQSLHETSSTSLSRAGQSSPAGAVADLREAAKLIVKETNAFRIQQELPPVADNESLQKAADYFAHFMAETDKYGHTADGNEPRDRAREHGYEACIVAENIGWQYSSRALTARELADRFVDGWEHSDEHRRNMLDADVSETGVAVAHSDKTDHYYAVQMFGRPKSLSLHLRLTNRSDATIEYELAEQDFSLESQYIRTHELCRPTELVVHDPDRAGEEKVQTIPVKTAGSYTIDRDRDGKLRIVPDATSASGRQPERR